MKLSVVAKLMKAGQTAKRLLRYVSKKAICLRADLGFGKMPLRRKQLAWAAQVLRAFVEGTRASEARHMVFSVRKGTPRGEAIKLLFEVFHDWRTTYAPGRPWVAAIHFHEGRYHLHVAIANVGADGKPLKFKPHQVVAMSEMAFTTKAISAKGQGKKGLPIYTKARSKLAVEDLAALLVSPAGDINDDAWERLEKAGIITNFRTRKSGTPISFEYEGRRIRFSTLRAFMLDQHQNKTNTHTMPTDTIKPDKALPDSIAEALKTAGFSSDDLTSLQRNLKAAHDSQPSLPAPSKTIQPNQSKTK